MSNDALHQFYQFVLLPQFGFSKDGAYNWLKSTNIGPDETAHWFVRKEINYVLIYEDYDGLGRNKDYILSELSLKDDQYSFVEPNSATDRSPSYSVNFPVPSIHTHNVTGTFTLLELNK